MISKNISVHVTDNKEEHPVALLVKTASQFESKILIETGNKRINGKSIMGMMSLGLDDLDSITVVADGADEETAITAIEEYLTKGA